MMPRRHPQRVLFAICCLLVLATLLASAEDSGAASPARRPSDTPPPDGSSSSVGGTTDDAALAVASTEAPPADGPAAAAPPLSPGESTFSAALTSIYIDSNLTKGVELLEQSAAHGFGRAMLFLGVLHIHGIEVAQSDAKAVTYLTFAAMAGVPEAHAALSYRHQHGLGVAQSCEAAVRHARAATEPVAAGLYTSIRPKARQDRLAPDASAAAPKRNAVGMVLATEVEFVQHHFYRAEKGSAESMMTLGHAYAHGTHGLTQDGYEALRYYAMAMDANEVTAYGATGQLYATGMSTADPPILQNLDKAKDFFLKGAAHGNPVCLNGLGYLYATSAAAMGRSPAATASPPSPPTEADGQQQQLAMAPGSTTTNTAAAQLREDMFQKAFKYFERAALTGNIEAIYNTGVLLLHGRGVQQNIPKGVELLTKASAAGSLLARWQLAELSASPPPTTTTTAAAGSGVAAKKVLSLSCSARLTFYKSLLQEGPWHDAVDEAHGFYQDSRPLQSLLEYLIAAEVGNQAATLNAAHLLESRFVSAVIPKTLRSTETSASSSSSATPSSATGAAEEAAAEGESGPSADGSASDTVQQDDAANAVTKEAASEDAEAEDVDEGEDRLLSEHEFFVRRFRADGRPVTARDAAQDALVLGLLRRGAMEGDDEAALKLGDWHHAGRGTGVDKPLAGEFYQRAARLHNAQALFNLGMMHQFGELHDTAPGSAALLGDEDATSGRTIASDTSSSTADFHLAKRYYDDALTYCPDSYYAVAVMLTVLNFQWWYAHALAHPAWLVVLPRPFGYALDDFLIVMLVGLTLLLLLLRNHAARG